jgi:uncharacterized protein (DUF1330 family)
MPADQPFTLAFVGYAEAEQAERASAYEDEVLALLADHGARVVYRGRRRGAPDGAVPLEVHLIWFPDRGALDGYMADERRQALLAEYGEVFTTKHAFEIETLNGSLG